jgi:hypothetical protein
MKKLTILIAAIALVCFSVPAMAVDWNFYGSARMATYYVSDDLGDAKTDAGNDGLSDLQWDLQGNSRIGANVKAEHLKGQFEFGLNSTSAGGGTVTNRRIYGVWNFGPGTLKVGKDYTPVSQFISGQVYDADLGLLGIGTMYGNREGQVSFGFGGFEIALIQPVSGTIEGMEDTTSSLPATITTRGGVGFSTPGATATTYTFAGDVQEYLPKIEAKWGMSFDAFNFNLMGGFNYYSIKDVVSQKDGKKNDVEVTSYVVGGDAGFNFGPGYVKAALSYGQNWGNAAWALDGNHNQGSPAVWDGDDGTKDTTSWMGALVAGMKVSDTLSFEAGFGYREDNPDANGWDKSKPWNVYAQSVIVLAPGVYIIPEVGYFDGDKTFTDTDATSTFYLGGKWQIDF